MALYSKLTNHITWGQLDQYQQPSIERHLYMFNIHSRHENI